MKNEKIPTSIGIMMIVVITVTIGVSMWKIKKNNPVEPNQKTSSQMNKIDDSRKESGPEISDKWILVSHYNFWSNPNIFTRNKYNFPDIEFSYPDNWEFVCCNDMDHASTHIIYSSKEHNKSLPYIRITDYVLSGCPNSQDSCSLDRMIKITANEKFNRLTSSIRTADILPKIKLANLNTTAFSYKKSEENNKFSRGYIINIGNDVIEVDFVNHELLNDLFIENFLNHISFESK